MILHIYIFKKKLYAVDIKFNLNFYIIFHIFVIIIIVMLLLLLLLLLYY